MIGMVLKVGYTNSKNRTKNKKQITPNPIAIKRW